MAARKGYAPHYGYLSALIFGPLSLIVVALVPQTEEGRFQTELDAELDAEADYYDRKQSCPNCRREVSLATRVCPACEHHFAPPQGNAGRRASN